MVDKVMTSQAHWRMLLFKLPEANGSSPIVITTDAFQYVLHDGVRREQEETN
ncbi:MAG: hypothetical protein ABSE41_12050 [Bacteroidota bacterium]